MLKTSLCHEGWVSIYSFIAGAGLLFPFVASEIFELDLVTGAFWIRLTYLVLYHAALNLLLRLKIKGVDYQIAWRAALLGFVFSISLNIFMSAPTNWKAFGIYGTFLAIFHYSEYLGIAMSNPKTLSTESFILNHSLHYHLAAVSSWIEFGLESYYFPEFKTFQVFWIVGALMCLGGEILRKAAMITAAHNFTHIVQFERVENHRLVRHGVFALMRHPSYVGWFYWSIGTQIILINPICFVIYAVASWKFFHDRIFMEEITLINFFGEDYYIYQQQVPTGLPFIRGYKMEL